MSAQAYVDHASKLVIFWAPKSACTAVVDWFVNGLLKSRGMEDFSQTETLQGTFTKSPRTWLDQCGYNIAGVHAARLMLDHGYQGIYFVREPFSRIVSSYTNKFVNYHGRPLLTFDDLQGFSRQLYCELKGCTPAQARQSYEGISITELVEFVLRRCEERKAGKPAHLDHHWDVQVAPDFLAFYRKLGGVRICQIENIQAGWDFINSVTGINYVPGKYNKSHYGEPGQLKEVPTRSSVDLARQPALPHPKDFDTTALRQLVEKAYQDDYTLLGYERTTAPSGSLPIPALATLVRP